MWPTRQLSNFLRSLTAKLGKTVDMTVETDASLIGGALFEPAIWLSTVQFVGACTSCDCVEILTEEPVMQQLNPSEISDIIKQRISQLDVASQATNEGTIVSVTDGIIRIHGLTEVQYGEMIEFEGNVFGLALNLERDSVGAVVLGDYKQWLRPNLPLYWSNP